MSINHTIQYNERATPNSEAREDIVLGCLGVGVKPSVDFIVIFCTRCINTKHPILDPKPAANQLYLFTAL